MIAMHRALREARGATRQSDPSRVGLFFTSLAISPSGARIDAVPPTPLKLSSPEADVQEESLTGGSRKKRASWLRSHGSARDSS